MKARNSILVVLSVIFLLAGTFSMLIPVEAEAPQGDEDVDWVTHSGFTVASGTTETYSEVEWYQNNDIWVYGTLNIYGSDIRMYSSQYIRVYSGGVLNLINSNVSMYSGSYWYLDVEGRAYIENCLLRDTRYGLEVSSSGKAFIGNSTIYSSYSYGLYNNGISGGTSELTAYNVDITSTTSSYGIYNRYTTMKLDTIYISYANSNGIYNYYSHSFYAKDITIDYCRNYGVYNYYSTAQIDGLYIDYVSGSYGIYNRYSSILSGSDIDIDYVTGTYGVYNYGNSAQRPTIDVDGLRIGRASSYGIYNYYGNLYGGDYVIDYAGSYGIYAYYYANIDLDGLEINDCGSYGMYVYYYATLDITDLSINDTGSYGIYCYYPHKFDLNNAEISNTRSYGVYLNNVRYGTSGIANLNGLTIHDTNSYGMYSLKAFFDNGGRNLYGIRVVGSNARNAGGADADKVDTSKAQLIYHLSPS